VAKSENFVAVLVQEGVDSFTEKTAERLRPRETTKEQMMAMVRIEKFVAVPDSFEVTVAACLKAYPTPLAEK
jgi:hypothetical protein